MTNNSQTKRNKRIICVHLLNDFSGSPLVFSQSVRALVEQGYTVDLYTSNTASEGFLSNIEGVNYNWINYNWSSVKLLTLFKLILSQMVLFFKLLKYINKPALIYINTVLPFGAAIAAKVMGKKLIYHLHETSIKPLIWNKFLFAICNNTASEVIYVSEFLQQSQPLSKPKSIQISNALSDDFVALSKAHYPVHSDPFNVLMLASLKEYKGVNDFLYVAEQLPHLHFDLVLNADQEAVNAYFSDVELPANLELFPSQSNVHPFYKRAHLVMNLSHPDKWVETFGMTALEGMCYGLPVIVPPVGGIAELVQNGYNGYKIDVHNKEQLLSKIHEIYTDKALYTTLSGNAKKASEKYSTEEFKKQLGQAISSLI